MVSRSLGLIRIRIRNRQLRRTFPVRQTALALFADSEPLWDVEGGIVLHFLLHYVTVGWLVPANQ